MAVRLERALRSHGCDFSSEKFREMLADMFHKMFPNWNDEDLLHNPVEAIRFCNAIRQVPGCGGLEDDEVILRALSGMRKSSSTISSRKRSRLSRLS
jgi:hypothetical protein